MPPIARRSGRAELLPSPSPALALAAAAAAAPEHAAAAKLRYMRALKALVAGPSSYVLLQEKRKQVRGHGGGGGGHVGCIGLAQRHAAGWLATTR